MMKTLKSILLGLLLTGLGSVAQAQTVTTYDISHVGRWGSWSVDRGTAPNTNSAMNSDECVIAAQFVGTQIEMHLGADTGADNYTNPAFSVSVDGGPYRTFPISGVSGSSPSQWIPMVQGITLTDGPHKLLEKIVFPYYGAPYQWCLSTAAAVRVTGANPACSALTYRSAPGGKVIVYVGDSRTQGTGSTDGPFASEPYSYNNLGAAYKGNSYPADFHRAYLDSTWTATNEGSYSSTAAQLLTREQSDVLSQFDPANTRNALLFWGGVNDLNGGTSAAALETTVKAYIANAKGAGVKEIVIGTLPYVAGAGIYNIPAITTYNADLRAGWQAWGATGLADVDADPAYSGHAATADWSPDSLHHSDSGQLKDAAIFNAAFTHQTFAAAPPPASAAFVLAMFTAPATGIVTISGWGSSQAVTIIRLSDGQVINVAAGTASWTDSARPSEGQAVTYLVLPVH